MSDLPKLLGCPCCGSSADYAVDGQGDGVQAWLWLVAKCSNDECGLKTGTSSMYFNQLPGETHPKFYLNHQEVADKWNKRANEPVRN